jgi:DNA-directed RNA polymerase subunit B"
MVEISNGVSNEEEVKNTLYEMGVIALRRETA